VVTCRLVAAPGVLEDPDFEVRFLEIHTVKIYEKSVEGAEYLALPYGIVGMSENIQDFWLRPIIRKPKMPELLENPLTDL